MDRVLGGVEALGMLTRFSALTLAAVATSPALLVPSKRSLPINLFAEGVSSLGPTATKFLQWVSTRPDVFPTTVCNQAAVYQTRVPADPFPLVWKRARQCVASAATPYKVYMSPTPLGCGSVAQTHRVYLKKRNGPWQSAVMKVLRPNVQRKVLNDLHVMRMAGQIIARIMGETNEWLPLNQYIEQFAQFIVPQTSLINEAVNIRKFNSNFSQRWRLRQPFKLIIPTLYEDLITEEVLTESYEPGVPLDEVLQKSSNVRLKSKLAKFGCHVFLTMLLHHNFVHCDLHPGNILVDLKSKLGWRPWRHRPRLVLLDAGLTSALSDRDLRDFMDLFRALAFGDGYEAGRLLYERTDKHDCQDPDRFCWEISRVVERHIGPRIWNPRLIRPRLVLDKLNIGIIMREVLKICINSKIQLRPEFLGVILAMTVIEGIGTQLDPKLDLLAAARPFITSITVKQINARF